MFCTKCGANNADGTRFCTACGTPLLNNQPETPVASEAPVYTPPVYDAPEDVATVYAPPVYEAPSQPIPEAPVYEAPVQQVPQTQYYNPDMAYANQPEPPKKKGKIGLIVGIILGVLVLVVAVAAILLATGVIDLDASGTNTEETSKKNNKKDEEEIAKESLVGAWALSLEGDEVYDYGMTTLNLPYTLVLSSDGTYYVTADPEKFDDFVYNTMMDVLLEGDSDFEINDDKIRVRTSPSTLPDDSNRLYYKGEKVKLNKGHRVTVVEIVNSPNDTENPKWCHIEFSYEGAWLEGYVSADYVSPTNGSAGEVTMEALKAEVLSGCAFSDYGYWAANGESIFFTNSESEANDFLENPDDYENDVRVIFIGSTEGISEFSESLDDGTIVLTKVN